ncbi:DUF3139 domain-containing protein [Paenibacillus sp. KS-LC4]|uniref:DUF3139 domain-containing protein n=1 Tax=Paenibacillus sp. KS-LC4 TaxID=2979727 RepID=UPI0030CC97D9
MYRKKVVLFFAILVFLLIILYAFFSIKEYQLKKSVVDYLKEKNYQESEILSIDTSIAKAPVFSARVIFFDEPDIIYYYRNKDGKIIQYGTPSNLKSTNNTDEQSFKHQEHQ